MIAAWSSAAKGIFTLSVQPGETVRFEFNIGTASRPAARHFFSTESPSIFGKPRSRMARP